MSNISDYLEEKWLAMLKGTAYSAPTAYCGIVSDAAVDADMEAGTLTDEIDGYDGNRPAITFGDISQVSGKATMSNSADLDFEDMPAVTVKYAIICDGATKGAGNILYWCPLTEEKVVGTGSIFRIPAENLTIDLA